MTEQPPEKVAFVLGGGGIRGGYEVGMVRALLEAGISPSLIVGTSIGSVNGALLAERPNLDGYLRLVDLWRDIVSSRLLHPPLWQTLWTLATTRSHFGDERLIRSLLAKYLGGRQIEDLAVPFQCAAAGIERASTRWFDSGSLMRAVQASSCVPGMWPPVRIDGEHFFDGGLVESIPISRAVSLGATTVYVLHVGRINKQLKPPKWVWQAATVSLEISRRHSFYNVLHNLPTGVNVHILPTGSTGPDEDIDIFDSTNDQHEEVRTRMDNAYRASRDYLAGNVLAPLARVELN